MYVATGLGPMVSIKDMRIGGTRGGLRLGLNGFGTVNWQWLGWHCMPCHHLHHWIPTILLSFDRAAPFTQETGVQGPGTPVGEEEWGIKAGCCLRALTFRLDTEHWQDYINIWFCSNLWVAAECFNAQVIIIRWVLLDVLAKDDFENLYEVACSLGWDKIFSKKTHA